MANTNYKKFYSTLGVFQDDDWETVRTAYKRQIRRWHPDRFQDTELRKIAEDKSKDINLAYQTLDDYFREFGSLPPDDTSQKQPAPPTGDQSPAQEYDTGPEHDEFSESDLAKTSFRESDQTRHSGYARIIAVVIVIASGYIMLEPLFTESQNASEITLPGNHDSGPSVGNSNANQVGSTNLSMEHAPVTTVDVHPDWSASEKVMGHTLKPGTTSVRPTYISIGSSMQDVLAIQGRPLRQTDTAWDYGLSRINFQDGLVTGWSENPMNPLIVKR